MASQHRSGARATRCDLETNSARPVSSSTSRRHIHDDFDLEQGGLRVTAVTELPRAATSVHRWRAFAVLAVAYFMTIVDLTIVNVALPTIGRKLHFSEANLQWVVTAYGVAFGEFLLLSGRADDLLGRP